MSRFGNYLETAKLAKMLLAEAEIRLKKGDHPEKAIQFVIDAQRQFLTALNCFASLHFQPRKKFTVKPKLPVREGGTL